MDVQIAAIVSTYGIALVTGLWSFVDWRYEKGAYQRREKDHE